MARITGAAPLSGAPATQESTATQRQASHHGSHEQASNAPDQDQRTRSGPTHPIRSNAPDQDQHTRSGPTHPIRRGAMPTDRVYRHRQQAQTRKRAVNTGTTRPSQARRSHDKTTPGPPQPHHNPDPTAPRAQPAVRPQNAGLHNVSVTWARQVVALTLSCAAGPYRWSMGNPAHAPPMGLTCASKGPGTHPSGRTCHPTAGRPRGPQHVLQPHIGTVVHRARHAPNHTAPRAQPAVRP